MKTFFTSLLLGVFISAILLYNPTQAQRTTNVNTLNTLSEKWSRDFTFNKVNAVDFAKRNNLPLIFTDPEGRYFEMQNISNEGVPQYYMTENAVSAATIATNHVYTGGGAGLDLDGSGITIRLWDAAAVRSTHQEFGGRVVQVDGVTTTNSHSTHVAGTLIAAGVVPAAKGMAPLASLRAFDWNDDQSEMASEAAGGSLISSHSYGYVRGWYNTGSSWIWYGNPSISTLEDYLFGFYDSQARDWDQIAFNAPYYLICKSAGNDRNEGPNQGQYPKDGPYDCISHAGVAKNILTVGAVNDIAGGYINSSSVVMTSYSCWGPADDGRIKPDIVASGQGLYSSYNTSNTSYNTLSGTSMASPSIAGSLALLQQHWENLHGSGNHMLAATLKALVIHTADEAGSADGPDYKFGWGLMNTEKAALKISEDQNVNVIDELTLNNDDTYTRTVYSDGSMPLKVTVCWTDPAGTPVSAQLDPVTHMLVNDLDVRITNNGATYYPWKLNRDNPTAAATNNSDNEVDNIEVIYIASPAEGNYEITVSHKGTLVDGLQAFSMILSGISDVLGEYPPVADFSANQTTVQLGETVSFTDLSSNNPTTWNWIFTPSTITFVNGTDATSQNPEVTFDATGVYSVTLEVSNAYGSDTITYSDYIDVHNGIYAFPYTESFESGFGDWNQATDDDFNWTRISGPTPLKKTGPNKAYSGSYYLYTKSSNPRNRGDEACLTATFDFTGIGNPQLSFYYHMYGSGMGTLAVDIYDGTWHMAVWSKSGQQQNSKTSSYTKATVSLNSFANMSGIIIRFRGVLGTASLSDMAFDYVQINNVPRSFEISIPEKNSSGETPITTTLQDLKVTVYAWENTININCQGPSSSQGNIEVFTMMGQPIYSVSIGQNGHQAIKMLSGSGLYIVRITIEGKIYTEKVFIK